MRKTLLSALSLPLLSACAQGYIPETANHPVMYPSNLPEILALHITENAKGCKDFRITQGQALAYFHTANIVKASSGKTPVCVVHGDLTFAFEGKAKWTINQDGSATLVKQNGTELKLLCPDCILGNVH